MYSIDFNINKIHACVAQANTPLKVRTVCNLTSSGEGTTKALTYLQIKIDKAQRHPHWTFDLPEADKCLLAFGELGVGRSKFNLFEILPESVFI